MLLGVEFYLTLTLIFLIVRHDNLGVFITVKDH